MARLMARLLSVVVLLGPLTLTQAAHAVGVPVLLDGFGNPKITTVSPFTRTVTLLPAPHTSTTPQGTFTQTSDFLGHMTMSGAGNGTSGVALSYDKAAGLDLTGAGNNGQILLEIALVNQVRAAGDNSVPGMSVYIDATDKNGGTVRSPLDAVGNYWAFNAAFPFTGFQSFHCVNGPGTCSGESAINWTQIKDVTVTFVYPATNTGGGSLTVDVKKMWATPIAGAAPSAPNPSVTAPATAVGNSTTPVNFTIAFTNGEGAAPVTYNPPSNIGLRAQDVAVSGTAFNGHTPQVAISGGPSTYTFAVSGMVRDGTVTVHVPGSVVKDGWDQFNPASSNDPVVAFTLAVPPQFASANHSSFTVGTPGTFSVSAMGGSPAPEPIPQITLQSGALPAGVTLTDNGDGTASLSGTPAAGSGQDYPIVLKAANAAGTVTQSFDLVADEAPTITSAATTTFTTGIPGTFTVTTGHAYPASPALSLASGTLPAGVTFTDNGDGTATIAGTSQTPSAGSYPLQLSASNAISPAATQSFALVVAAPPTTSTANSSNGPGGSTGSGGKDPGSSADSKVLRITSIAPGKHSGELVLVIHVSGAGKLGVVARQTSKHAKVYGKASKHPKKAATLRVVVKPTAAGRRLLSSTPHPRLRVTISFRRKGKTHTTVRTVRV